MLEFTVARAMHKARPSDILPGKNNNQTPRIFGQSSPPMNGMNRVILIGHIGTDPEVRSTAAGKRVVRLSVATHNARKVDGAWVDGADWHRVVAFDRTAEFLGRFARKGDLLAVDCVLRPRKWEDANGKTQYDVNIVVDRVAALHSRTRRDVADLAGSSETAADSVLMPLPIDVDAAPEESAELPF
jgi:single-strand DNA-binding protein